MQPEFWIALELALTDVDRDVLKAYRKTMIGRGKPLRARDFDNAVRGASKATEMEADSTDAKVKRAWWALHHGLPPIFARPSGYEFTLNEKLVIRAARALDPPIEPVFISYDESGIDIVPGPSTDLLLREDADA